MSAVDPVERRVRALAVVIAGVAVVIAAQPEAQQVSAPPAIEAPIEAPIAAPIARAPEPTAEPAPVATVEPTPAIEDLAPIQVEDVAPAATARPRPAPARPPPSPTVAPAPVPSPVAPAPLSADERLGRALAQRGLELADLPDLPDADTEIRRFRARPEGGLEAAIAAIDEARLPTSLLRRKLDRLAAALRIAAKTLPPDELASREKRYLDLETRLSMDPSNTERHAILADAVRLGRGF